MVLLGRLELVWMHAKVFDQQDVYIEVACIQRVAVYHFGAYE